MCHEKKEERVKLLNKNYILLTLVNLITSLGFSMIVTLISPYGVVLGADLTTAGALAGVFSLSALFIRPFSGYMADRIDKRKICLWSTVLIAVAIFSYALMPGIKTLMVARILHGIAFGINGTSNIALVCKFVPQTRIGEGIGYFGLGQMFAQVCGPSVGISILNSSGYNALFYIITAMTAVAVFVLLFVDSTHEEKPAKRQLFSVHNLIAKECIVYALVGGVFSLGNGIVSAFLVLLGEERTIVGIVLFFSVNAVALFLLRFVGGKIADRFSLSLVVNTSLIMSAVYMVIIGSANVMWMFLVAAILKAAAQSGGQISLQSACVKRVSAQRIGIATSTFFIGGDIGQGLGPIIGGKLILLYDYKTMFFCVAGLSLLVMLGFNIYQHHFKKQTALHSRAHNF